jgi:hypothetical protein
MPFLTAQWRDVAGITFACDDARLAPLVPQGATIDHLDGAARWLTDHALGVGTRRDGTSMLYRVDHPTWALHDVLDSHLDVDFAAVYGPEWAWLADTTPSHVTLATGSAVAVSRPRRATA